MTLTEIQKYEIISKFNNNWSISKIAQSMKINRHTVSLWITRYKNEGNIFRKRGSGTYKSKIIRQQINNQ